MYVKFSCICIVVSSSVVSVPNVFVWVCFPCVMRVCTHGNTRVFSLMSCSHLVCLSYSCLLEGSWQSLRGIFSVL